MNNDIGIESPCISVCMIDEEEGYCRGCYRSLNEIGAWLTFSQSQRRAIMKQLEGRRSGDLPQSTNPTMSEDI